MLIAAEVALSIVLVVGAVLLGRSLVRLQAVDPGFDQNHVVTFTLSLPPARYANAAERLRAFEEIDRRLREQPGVQAAGAVSTLALRGYTWTGDATIEGRAAADYERELRHKSVTPDYFKAMGIRLLAGRIFNDGDTHRSAARHRRQRGAGEEVLPRRRPPRQADQVRAAGGQRRLGHGHRRRRRREAGRPRSRGPASGVFDDQAADAEPADLRRALDARRCGRGGGGATRGAGRRSRSRADGCRADACGRRRIDGRSPFPHHAAGVRLPASPCCWPRSGSTACSPISSRSARASWASAWRWARGRRRCSRWWCGRGCGRWSSAR